MVDVLRALVCAWRYPEDVGRQRPVSIVLLLGDIIPRCLISPFLPSFLLFCRFSSTSGAGGSFTLVRGSILGREDTCGSAVLCPRALPGYLL